MATVDVFLIRHEEAESSFDLPDGHRALTGNGRRRMRRTARLVRDQPETIDVVFTSPLVRAVQTAEILAEALGLDGPIFSRAQIADPPTIDSVIDLVRSVPGDARGVAIVGHEPTMSGLAATLLDLPVYPRPFKKGSVLALSLDRNTEDCRFKWLILGKGPTRLASLEDRAGANEPG